MMILNESGESQLNDLSSQIKFYKEILDSWKIKTLRTSNLKWEYYFLGKGNRNLIFFPGAMIGPQMYFYPIHSLSNNYRIFLPIILEFVSSFEEYIEFYEKLVERESISKPTLIGYSYGGGIVQMLMDQHPELTDRVVLYHTGLLWGREASPFNRLVLYLLKIIPTNLLRNVLIKMRIEKYPDSKWNEFHTYYFLTRLQNFEKSVIIDFLRSSDVFIRYFNKKNSHLDDFSGTVILLATKGNKNSYPSFF